MQLHRDECSKLVSRQTLNLQRKIGEGTIVVIWRGELDPLRSPISKCPLTPKTQFKKLNQIRSDQHLITTFFSRLLNLRSTQSKTCIFESEAEREGLPGSRKRDLLPDLRRWGLLVTGFSNMTGVSWFCSTLQKAHHHHFFTRDLDRAGENWSWRGVGFMAAEIFNALSRD